jgi:methionine-rich copper-binding protein CopC
MKPSVFSLVGVMLCAIAPSAYAHAFLDTADPAVGATLNAAPTVVTLTFSEGLEPHFSSITVVDAGGQRVDLNDFHAVADDPKRIAVGLKPLVPGSYKVVWRATSVDSHKTNGSYSFKLAP